VSQLTEHAGADRARSLDLLAALHGRLVVRGGGCFVTDGTAVRVYRRGVTALGQSGAIEVQAPAVMGAVGGAQQPMLFAGNDVPGVMTVGAAQRLMRLYGVKPGRRAVVATATGVGYGVALDLIEAGVQVAAVLDLRSDPGPDPRVETLRDKSVRIEFGVAPVEALEGPDGSVGGLRLAALNGGGAVDQTIEADLICVEAGFSPDAMLAVEAGCRLTWTAAAQRIQVSDAPSWFFPVGRLAGADSLDQSAESGAAAARQAVSGARAAEAGAGPDAAAGREAFALSLIHISEPTRPY